jgi:hypothetical protein
MDFELRCNKHSGIKVCGVCGSEFVSAGGPWQFIQGTRDSVCTPCFERDAPARLVLERRRHREAWLRSYTAALGRQMSPVELLRKAAC